MDAWLTRSTKPPPSPAFSRCLQVSTTRLSLFTPNHHPKAHGATKAQVLVRWAAQRGFVPLPRSGVGSEAEQLAIRQNSARGVSGRGWESKRATHGSLVTRDWVGGPLSAKEMGRLDAMDQQTCAGRLGRVDGWAEGDIAGSEWDPTLVV